MQNFEKLKNEGELFTYLSLILAIAHVHVETLIAKSSDSRLWSPTELRDHRRTCNQPQITIICYAL